MVQDIENLKDDVGIVFPGSELRVQDLIAMHLDHPISYLLVLAFLNTFQKLDGDPFFLALHEGSHDLGHTICVERLGFNTVDIFLIILASLLLARLLCHSSIPSICLVNAKSLDGGSGQFGGTLGLSLATDEASAICFSAIAWLWVGPIPVNVVVENQFFASFDFLLGKDAHSEFVANHPLVNIAIRVAGVIAEAPQVSFLGRVDKFSFAEGHEIKVLDAFVVILDHTSTKLWLVDDFTNILVDEITRTKISICSESITFLFGFDNRDVGVLSLLETLVLTAGAAPAIPGTLHFRGPIDTVGIFATCVVSLCR